MRSTVVSGIQLTLAVSGPAAWGWTNTLLDEVAPADPLKVSVVCVGQAEPVDEVLVLVVEVLTVVVDEAVTVVVVVVIVEVPVVVEPPEVVVEVVPRVQLHG